MNLAEPARTSRWKRRILRILAALVLAPVVLVLLANLALATPWARGWLARKISARTGVEAVVGSASWTPWGGACIGDLTLLQPVALRSAVREPLLKVRGIRAFPRWDQLPRGKLEIVRLRIEHPHAVIPLEMLGSIVSANALAAAKPPATPTLAAADRPSEASATPIPASPVAPPPPSPSPSAPAVVERPDDPPPVAAATAWIEIQGGHLEFLLGGSRVLQVSGFDGKIPVAGAAASSTCHVGQVESLGRSLVADLSLPLFWDRSELRVQAADLPVAGMRVNLTAVLGRMRGTPFAMEVMVPSQAVDGAGLFKTLRPAAGKLEARMQARGFLRIPASWEGVAQLTAGQVVMDVASQEMKFDEARAVFGLQGGVLQCPDARLTGDRMSLLGNGRVQTDGQGAAVVRAVVPPEIAAAWSERLATPGQRPAFAPLGTPDRQFIDLRWLPYSGGHGIELGAGGPVVPAGEIARLFGQM